MEHRLCSNSGCSNKAKKPDHNFCGPCIMSKHRYGLTVPERDALLLEQGGRCLICKVEITFSGVSGSKINTANVDHCHKCQHVRGILCWPCNTAIGKLGEDVERIRSAANYVERHLQLAL